MAGRGFVRRRGRTESLGQAASGWHLKAVVIMVRQRLGKKMDVDHFLNLLATLFGAVGSLYVLKGLIALSPEVMSRLSQSYYDYSPTQITALAGQRADGIVGVVVGLVALALGVANIALVPSDVTAFKSR